MLQRIHTRRRHVGIVRQIAGGVEERIRIAALVPAERVEVHQRIDARRRHIGIVRQIVCGIEPADDVVPDIPRARTCVGAGVRQPALAGHERVGHQVARCIVSMIEPEDVCRSRASPRSAGPSARPARRRIGLRVRRRQGVPELGVVERRRIDEPATAGRVVVDDNVPPIHPWRAERSPCDAGFGEKARRGIPVIGRAEQSNRFNAAAKPRVRRSPVSMSALPTPGPRPSAAIRGGASVVSRWKLLPLITSRAKRQTATWIVALPGFNAPMNCLDLGVGRSDPPAIGPPAASKMPKSLVVETVPCLRIPMPTVPLLPGARVAEDVEIDRVVDAGRLPASTRMPSRTDPPVLLGASTVLLAILK